MSRQRKYVIDSCIECDGHKKRDVAVEGRVVFVQFKDIYWGEHGSTYIGPLLENPTWSHVLDETDKMIEVVQDKHHVFLEGIGEIEDRPITKVPQLKDEWLLAYFLSVESNVKVYTFYMGS